MWSSARRCRRAVNFYDRHEPAVLWNDIGYPKNANAHQLFVDYYDRVPDGLVNDRFATRDRSVEIHRDFRTPEYVTFHEITPTPWESCRGIGSSFGYNRDETSSTSSSTS